VSLRVAALTVASSECTASGRTSSRRARVARLTALAVVLTLATFAADGSTAPSGTAGADAATLHGSLDPERSTNAPRVPDRIDVRLWRVGRESEPPLTISCPVTQLTWNCRAPEGVFDVELRVEGFARHYRWGVQLDASTPLDIGPLQLAIGTSITGTVQHDGAPLADVTVELTPEAGANGSDVRRANLRTQSDKSDANGRFAFADIGRGSFLLVARKPGYSTVSRAALRIEPPATSQLPPLEMRPLASVRLYVTPPLDFVGKPWMIHLRQPIPASAHYQVVRRGAATEIGEWVADQLDSGAYTIEVRDSSGNRIEQREVELLQDDIVTIAVDHFPLEGTITVADAPVKAHITLTSEDGSSLAFRSDAEGRFSGSLTSEGRWRPSVRFSRGVLHLAPIDVRRGPEGIGRVALKLPGGALSGSVVDANGKPTAATILLFRGDVIEVSAQTADDGRFRFIGLETGERRVQAMAPAGETGRIPVNIVDDDSADVILALRASKRIRGRVVDTSGQPIPGAKILARSSHSEQRGLESGLDGDFSLAIPADTTTVSLAIVTPGFPIRMLTLRPPFGGDRPIPIVLGGSAARLHIDCRGTTPPWPEVSRDNSVPFALFNLFMPRPGGPPREYTPPSGFTLEVEPGEYQVCWAPAGECATATIAPGSRKSVQRLAKTTDRENK